jgi:hypothetical protein
MFDAIGNALADVTTTALPATTLPLVKIITVQFAAVLVWFAATI